jgi:pantetheine-phosphate adenylyltransferase
MRRIGLFPGSFDPVTNGHLDLVRGAFALVDHLVIAIGVHPSKTPLFLAEERAALLAETCSPLAKAAGTTFETGTFSGLVIDEAKRRNASVLVRGLRDGTDLDYEMQMAGMNGAMAPWLQTVFLPASPADRPITATLVRQIAAMGGDVSPFVPAAVARQIMQKMKKPA